MNYINILKKEDNYIEVELINEEHSLPNLLKELLLAKKDKVIVAYYSVEHPILDPDKHIYVSNPVLSVKTFEGVNAEEVLKEALNDVIKLCNKVF